MIRRLLYGCCACLVVIVLWGFHFYSPFTYGHVALSSAEINRRKWLKTWDMLSHPNTWHTLLLVPNLLLLQTSFVAQKPKGSGNQTKTCVAMLHPGNFWETGHKQSATQGCLGLFGYKKKRCRLGLAGLMCFHWRKKNLENKLDVLYYFIPKDDQLALRVILPTFRPFSRLPKQS